MKNYKLEWYIPETNSYIYDDEVINLITPKYERAKIILEGIEDLIQKYKDEGELTTGNLTSKYLGYEGLLEDIYEELDSYFEYR